MQGQRDREPTSRPGRRPRRSLGEWCGICLLLVWGILWLVIFKHFFRFPDTRTGFLFSILPLMQGAFSVLGGLAAWLRYRGIVPGLIAVATLCTVVMVILTLLGGFEEHNPPRKIRIDLSLGHLIIPAIFLGIALLLLFVGRWLGRQEDIKE